MSETRLTNPKEIAFHEKDVDLLQYKKGTSIVINVKGTWKEVKVVVPPVVDADTQKMILTIKTAEGSERKIVIDYAPEIVRFENGDRLYFVPLDGSPRQNYNVGESRILENGKIEYDVTDGVKVRGVPQEFLVLLREVAELEASIDVLTVDIRGRAVQISVGHNQKYVDVQKMLDVLKSHLPQLSDMPKKGMKVIGVIEKSFREKHIEVKEAIKNLKEEIEALTASDSRETLHENVFFLETAEEVSERKEFTTHAFLEVDRMIKLKTIPLEKRKEKAKENIEKAKEQKKEIEKERKRDLAAHNRTLANGVPKASELPDDQNVVFNNRLKEQNTIIENQEKDLVIIEEEKEQLEVDVWFDFYNKLDDSYPIQKKLKELIDKTRKKYAKKDILSPKYDDDFHKNKKMDGTDMASGDKVSMSAFAEKSVEVLKSILKAWESDESLLPPAETKVHANFDTEKAYVEERIDVLRKRLLDDDKKPKKGYESLYENLKMETEKWGKKFPHLETLERAKKEYLDIDTKELLDKKRVDLLNETRENLDGISKKINSKDFETGDTKAQEDIKEARNRIAQIALQERADKKEHESLVIDIPPAEIYQLMNTRQDAVRNIMRGIYEGMLGQSPRQVSGKSLSESVRSRHESVESMKNLFDTMPPNLEMLQRLSKYGIKNWDQFVRMWKEELGENTLKVMNEMAEMSIKGKIAERSTDLAMKMKQVRGMSGQIFAKMLISGGMIGGAAAGVALIGATGPIGIALSVLVGGAAGGGGRWLGFKAIFGEHKLGKILAERRKKIESELEDAMRQEIVDTIMAEQFGTGAIARKTSIGSSVKRMLSLSRREPTGSVSHTEGVPADSMSQMEGMWQFSSIMSEVIRQKTGKGKELAGTHPTGVSGFTTNERLIYERSLAKLETQNPSIEKKQELMLLIFHIIDHGDSIQSQVMEEAKRKGMNPSMDTLIDRILKTYGGQVSPSLSVAMGILVTGALMGGRETMKAFGMASEASIVGRGALGGIFGVIEGWKSGGQAIDKRERAKRRKELVDRMERVNKNVVALLRDSLLPNGVNYLDAENDFIYLKQLLHGSVSKEDLSAVVVLSKREGILPDHLLLTQIQSLVYEGERVGLLYEKEEQRAELDTVLSTMKLAGDRIKDGQKKSLGKSAKQFLVKYGAHTAGAVIGGTLGFIAGVGMGSAFDNARNGQPPWSTSGASYGGEIDQSELHQKIYDAQAKAVVLIPEAETLTPYKAPLIVDVSGNSNGASGREADFVDGDNKLSKNAVEVIPEVPERVVYGVHDTVEIQKGDNPWKIIRAQLDVVYKDDPVYKNLTDSGKDYIVDGIKDQYTSNPGAYRSSFIPGSEFRMGKLMDDYGGLEKVTEKMVSVDPSDTENHKLLRQLAHTRARIVAGIEHEHGLRIENTLKFVEQVNSAISTDGDGNIVVDERGNNVVNISALTNISADSDIIQQLKTSAKDAGYAFSDLVGAEAVEDHALLKFTSGSLEVYPRKTSDGGWQMHGPPEVKGSVDMKAVQAELDAAVARASGGGSASGNASNVLNFADYRGGRSQATGVGAGGVVGGAGESGGATVHKLFPGGEQSNTSVVSNPVEASVPEPEVIVPDVTLETLEERIENFSKWIRGYIYPDIAFTNISARNEYLSFFDSFSHETIVDTFGENGKFISKDLIQMIINTEDNPTRFNELFREMIENGEFGWISDEQKVLFGDLNSKSQGILVHPEGSNAIKFFHEGTQYFHVDNKLKFSNADNKLFVTSSGGMSYYAKPEVVVDQNGNVTVRFVPLIDLARQILDKVA